EAGQPVPQLTVDLSPILQGHDLLEEGPDLGVPPQPLGRDEVAIASAQYLVELGGQLAGPELPTGGEGGLCLLVPLLDQPCPLSGMEVVEGGLDGLLPGAARPVGGGCPQLADHPGQV